MHAGILGTSGSGKSTFARALAAELRGAGLRVGVLDPDLTPSWRAQFITDDAHRFLAWCRTVGDDGISTAAFVEEPGQSIDPRDRELWALATRIRKNAVRTFFVMQRWMDLPPTMRNQISRAYVFQICEDEARDLSRRYNAPALLAAPALKTGEFFAVTGQSCRRGALKKNRQRWKILLGRELKQAA